MKKAIVLGGTKPHVDLIKKLKDKDYKVILIDYLNDSPGIEFADEHVKESTLDKEKVLEIAQNYKADLVISTCIDQANSVCCYVAEKMSLPKPYSYKTSLNVTNKGLMKKIMVDNHIPTSPFITLNSLDNIPWESIKYPAVVKPVDCNSSKGVHRADSNKEITKFVEEALSLSRTKQAIIEGFNEGFEIQVDCFAENNSAKVIMTRQKKSIKEENSFVLQSVGSIIPAKLTEKDFIQIQDIAEKLAKAFELKNTPFFYQAIVTSKGISVLEFAPRIGGGLSYYLLKEIVGVDSIELAINSFLGISSEFIKKPINKCFSTNLLYMKPGIFSSIKGLEELKENKKIKEYFLYKKTGSKIDSDLRSGNRIASFVVEAENYAELNSLEKEILNHVSILDINGVDLTYRMAHK